MSEDTETLRAWLAHAETRKLDEQYAGLSERKRAELEFHDRYRTAGADDTKDPAYEEHYGNRKYYTATSRSTAYVEAWITRHAQGRRFLDYACGNGGNAIFAVRAGAELALGLDISGTAVENARNAAKRAGVSGKTFFIQADAEDTRLPGQSVDTVICSGMLHHLDLSYAFPELRRILSPGGRVLAVEALGHNAVIQLYRRMTPGMRTTWEAKHIIKMADLTFARRFFSLGEVKYWHLAEPLSPYVPWGRGVFRLLDVGLEKIPGLRLLAWIITFELIKS